MWGREEQSVSREEARALEPACLSVRHWATSRQFPSQWLEPACLSVRHWATSRQFPSQWRGVSHFTEEDISRF